MIGMSSIKATKGRNSEVYAYQLLLIVVVKTMIVVDKSIVIYKI